MTGAPTGTKRIVAFAMTGVGLREQVAFWRAVRARGQPSTFLVGVCVDDAYERKAGPRIRARDRPRWDKISVVLKPRPSRTISGIVHMPTMGDLMSMLNQFYYDGKLYGMVRPVHDATGLHGTYDIPVPWPAPGMNLLAEMGKLGLDVKSEPGTQHLLHVVHIEHLRTSCTIG